MRAHGYSNRGAAKLDGDGLVVFVWLDFRLFFRLFDGQRLGLLRARG